MTPPKLLKPEEVSVDVRKALHFDRQKFINGQMHIFSTCPSCKKERWLGCALIRSRSSTHTKIQGFSGLCHECYEPPIGVKIVYLKPEEAKEEIRHLIHFDQQEKKGNLLKVLVTCKSCGDDFWAHVSHIRRSAFFTALCRVCVNQKENNPNWKGWRSLSPEGYIRVHVGTQDENYKLLKPMITNQGWIMEHRLAVALHLGRPLERWEHIHHKNGDKADNRLENLEIVGAKTHVSITVAEKTVKSLRKENEILKQRIKELEELYGVA